MSAIRRVLPIAFVLAGAAAAQAAPAQTLSLSPSVVTLRGQFAQSARQTLTLTNVTALPLTFELEARDVVVREGRRVFVPAGERSDGIAASAVFSARTVSLPPGTARSVDVTLTVPRATTQRAVVVLFRGVTRIGARGKTAATVSLGTLFTFSLSDALSVVSTRMAVRPQTAASNLALDQTFVNDGQEPVVLKGMTAILDQAGTLVGRVPSPAHRLLPGERAVLHADYAGELAKGRYRALSTFDFEGRAVTRTAEFVVR
jgi:hypothetical protein